MPRLRLYPFLVLAGLALSTAANADAYRDRKPLPPSNYAEKLTPVDSGNGILVGEPIPVKANASTAEFGAACSYWLQVVVGGDGRMGKTPTIPDINRARFFFHKPNLRLSTKDAAPYIQMLGVTHTALSTITGGSTKCVLTYHLATSTGAAVGSPIALSGSYARILAQLPATAHKMLALLHGDGKNVPPGLAATPADMIVCGQNLADYDAPTSPDQLKHWKGAAGRTSMAGMFLVGNYDADQDVIDSIVKHSHGNTMVLSCLQFYMLGRDAGLNEEVEHAFAKYPNNYALARSAAAPMRVGDQVGMARATLERGVEAAPLNSLGWGELAEVLAMQGLIARETNAGKTVSDDDRQKLMDLYGRWEACLRKAIAIAPANVSAWEELAIAATYNNDVPTATSALDKSFALNPGGAQNYRWGLIFYGPDWMDDPTKRLSIAKAAIGKSYILFQVSSAILDAYNSSAAEPGIMDGVIMPALKVAVDKINDNDSDPSRLVNSAFLGVSKNSKDGRAWLKLGDAAGEATDHIRRGRYSSLLTPIEQAQINGLSTVTTASEQIAVNIDPTNVDAWLDLSVSAAFENKMGTAKDALQQALKLDPNNVRANRWAMQISQPKWGGSMDDMINAVKMVQGKPDLFAKLSLGIVAGLNSAIERDQPDANQLATANILKGEAQTALDDLLKHPLDSGDLWDMAYYLEQLGRIEDATKEYEAAVAHSPTDAQLNLALATVYYNQKMWEKAIGAYQAVLKLTPDDDKANFYCAVLINNHHNDHKTAEAMLRHLVQVKPDSARGYHWLGIVLQQEGDLFGARRAWTRASELDPEGKDEGDKARELLEQNPDPKAAPAKATKATLLDAVQRRDINAVTSLLSHKVDIDMRDSDGRTPLYLAAETDQAQIVMALIAKGADVNVKANDQKPLLAHIAEVGSVETLKYLLDHNADVNAADSYSSTALIYAVVHSKPDMVTLLIQHHADVNHKNNHNETALTIAVRDHHTRIVPILQAAGATQ